MTLQDVMTLLVSVTASFGIGAVTVIGLSGWLGNIWAKRILLKESAAIHTKLEELKHELELAKSSYEHYLNLLMDYYRVFYSHYRMCQRAATADAHRQAGREISYTRDEFFEELDVFLSDWADREGAIRLLLPAEALAIHEEAIDHFNNFKRTIDAFKGNDDTRAAKREAFERVEDVKNRMEGVLRGFLRTERLLK